MVGKYLWGTIQAHRVIDDLFWTQFFQNPEMVPRINIYLLEHKSSQVEVLDLNHRVEAQSKTLSQMENTCK